MFGTRERPAGAPDISVFYATEELGLTEVDIGRQFVIEGHWVGERDGQRLFEARRIQRVAPDGWAAASALEPEVWHIRQPLRNGWCVLPR